MLQWGTEMAQPGVAHSIHDYRWTARTEESQLEYRMGVYGKNNKAFQATEMTYEFIRYYFEEVYFHNLITRFMGPA